MSVFFNKGNAGAGDMHQRYRGNYLSARIFILLSALVTLVNTLSAVFSEGLEYTYYIIGSSLSFFFVDLGMFLCGKYPSELYVGPYAGMKFLGDGFFAAMIAISAVIVLALALAFFLSSRRVGWLIFAEVFYGIDTLSIFILSDLQSSDVLLEILAHAFVIVMVAIGIRAHYKLRAMPTEEQILEDMLPRDENGSLIDSIPLRNADRTVKERIFLEVNAAGHSIIYRRVKKTNELVIDERVYGEYVALAEMPHNLIAVIDGHIIEAGMNAGSKMYIKVDGEAVVKKQRWF